MKKKHLLVSLIAVTLLSNSYLHAASVGSGRTIPQGQLAVGAEYNHIFDKDMDPKTKGLDGYDSMEIDESNQVYGVISYGLFQNDRLAADLSVKLGAGDLVTQGVDGTFFNKERIEYDMGFLWGIGGKVGIQFDKGWSLSLHAGYDAWESDLDSITYSGEKAFNVEGAKTAKVSEFQAAILFNFHLDMKESNGMVFVPYVGPVFDWMRVKTGRISYETASFTSTNTATGAKDAKDNVGVVVGADVFCFNDALKLNVEGRFISEEALSVSLRYRF
ncbi:MAG: hypothetical protein HY593_00250 [Candidatus Omnitrophica bacterium]|nr:hypothetical protein [Elusimicrobiota bacterium]MBI4352332.1 hypothetical protein [Candidatus Omnitrophota bacterium]